MSNRSTPRKPRRRNASESRAAMWVTKHENETIRNGNLRDDNPISDGALTVRRLVLGPAVGGIFDRQGILDLLRGDHGADTYRHIGTSLVSPREGKQLVDPRRGELSQVMRKFEDVADAFAPKLEGFLGSAVISGASNKAAGVRFIGYRFNSELSSQLIREREELKTLASASNFRPKVLPRITLFRTLDRELAVDLRDQLKELNSPGMPVELGPVEVVPITQSRRFSR